MPPQKKAAAKRSKPKKKNPKNVQSVNFPDEDLEVYHMAKEVAGKLRLNFAQYVRRLIFQDLERYGKELLEGRHPLHPVQNLEFYLAAKKDLLSHSYPESIPQSTLVSDTQSEYLDSHKGESTNISDISEEDLVKLIGKEGVATLKTAMASLPRD